ncbi:hypothetical protein WH47_10685 [Habropoda laboriosa]|uniref:Uncharacterized protein n=1 Tax=Habropoda laboriosa TaxID=597456 RepID=A0A0L7RCC0_9HYME|nr:hypothetical protein WH47_10685 [Habropoda laboriosa]
MVSLRYLYITILLPTRLQITLYSKFCSRTLHNPQIYISFKDVDAISGTSMFWCLMDRTFWCRTDIIQPDKEVVAIVALDLPKFDKDPFCDAYGTISYETDEKQYQTPVPVIRLAVEETVDRSCEVQFLSEVNNSILALKSTSIEKTVGIQIDKNPERGERLLKFLEEKSFKEIRADVYFMKRTGCLMYCLIEILPITDGEARLRIFSRSSQQMNIILRLLRNQFPDMITEKDVDSVFAATVLIEELKLYLEDTSTPERQMARIRTDLLIP